MKEGKTEFIYNLGESPYSTWRNCLNGINNTLFLVFICTEDEDFHLLIIFVLEITPVVK